MTVDNQGPTGDDPFARVETLSVFRTAAAAFTFPARVIPKMLFLALPLLAVMALSVLLVIGMPALIAASLHTVLTGLNLLFLPPYVFFLAGMTQLAFEGTSFPIWPPAQVFAGRLWPYVGALALQVLVVLVPSFLLAGIGAATSGAAEGGEPIGAVLVVLIAIASLIVPPVAMVLAIFLSPAALVGVPNWVKDSVKLSRRLFWRLVAALIGLFVAMAVAFVLVFSLLAALIWASSLVNLLAPLAFFAQFLAVLVAGLYPTAVFVAFPALILKYLNEGETPTGA